LFIFRITAACLQYCFNNEFVVVGVYYTNTYFEARALISIILSSLDNTQKNGLCKREKKALPDLLILGARPAGLGSPEYAWSTRTSKKRIQQRDFLNLTLKLLLFIEILKLNIVRPEKLD
jgi:hypothetical protein